MPTAKILRDGVPFFGTVRNAGDILSADEVGLMTTQTISALVAQGILEMEGMTAGGEKASGLTATDHERIERLQAAADRTNDLLGTLIKKFDTFAAAKGKK